MPTKVPSDFLARYYGEKNPLRAIRAKCLDCCCGSASEVRKCVAVDCSLWPFRIGVNPFRKKRTLSAEQKRKMAERLSNQTEGTDMASPRKLTAPEANRGEAPNAANDMARACGGRWLP